MEWDRILGREPLLPTDSPVPGRTFQQHQRAFAQFLGQCGVDIDQVVNARGGLQDMLLALHRARKQIEEFRRKRDREKRRTEI